jgi:hypothetical protein
MGRSNFRLLKFSLLAFSLLHWSACLFYYAASWNNFNENTWVYKAGLVTAISNSLMLGPVAYTATCNWE